MANPTIIKIRPGIIAIIAFSLGPPGALIILVRFGINIVRTPIKITIDPVTIRIVFAMPIVSTSV
jgi:hypothetical protein